MNVIVLDFAVVDIKLPFCNLFVKDSFQVSVVIYEHVIVYMNICHCLPLVIRSRAIVSLKKECRPNLPFRVIF